MAPACVLLDRTVTFRNHPEEPEPLMGEEGAAAVVVVTTATSSSEPLSLESMEAEHAKYMRAMIKPSLQVVDAPGISRLTLAGQNMPSDFLVAAADKNLVVLYAGRPSSWYQGPYLVIDAASSSLSTIPGIRGHDHDYMFDGYSAVVVAREGGAFVLAELLFGFRRAGAPVLGKLCLWQSSCSSDQQGSEWVYKVGHLPAQVSHAWRVHVSFHVQSRDLLCWVDLLQGLLLCDLGRHCNVDSPDLGISFVPLPDSCSISEERRRSLNPQEFRTVACVDGEIKFFNIHGFTERGSISLVTYALNLDDGPSRSWTEETVLLLDDLWADQTFISMGVPRITPMFPYLSTQERDIVYLVIPGDLEYDEEGYRTRLVKFLLSVDTRRTKVMSATQENCPSTLFSSRYLLAFNASLSAALPDLKFHKARVLLSLRRTQVLSFINSNCRAVEAIEMGASGKKMKFE
ncbi:hypothetical protein EJB05_52772, partial [Eragrostis curvula]